MKITFISQKPPCFVNRDATHMPVDLAQQCAFNALNFHYSQLDTINEKFDVAILLIPKTGKDREALLNIDIVGKAKKIANKVWFMQEGPAWIFQDLNLHQQFWHYNVLLAVDGILCENETDIPYFKGLMPHKPVFDIPSVMIEDNILGAKTIQKQDKVMIGGNFCRWYGGFDSYIVAHELEVPIFAPSMGRKIEHEEHIEDLTHLPYMDWGQWIHKLAEFKYAIHLMPTIAAGTFAMNCGFLGIPCIGYDQADTQRKIHPKLSVKFGDIEGARKLAFKLKNDSDFYKECSKEALSNYKEYFSEEVFLDKMNKRLS